MRHALFLEGRYKFDVCLQGVVNGLGFLSAPGKLNVIFTRYFRYQRDKFALIVWGYLERQLSLGVEHSARCHSRSAIGHLKLTILGHSVECNRVLLFYHGGNEYHVLRELLHGGGCEIEWLALTIYLEFGDTIVPLPLGMDREFRIFPYLHPCRNVVACSVSIRICYVPHYVVFRLFGGGLKGNGVGDVFELLVHHVGLPSLHLTRLVH